VFLITTRFEFLLSLRIEAHAYTLLSTKANRVFGSQTLSSMMEGSTELEPFIKSGLKLLRRTKDSTSMKHMWKHFEDAIQEQYGNGRRPTNAAKKMSVPTALLSKDLGIEQVDVCIKCSTHTFSIFPSC